MTILRECLSLGIRTSCWTLLTLAFPVSVLGHAGINTRIADVSRHIDKDPGNASLYLKRGELHRLHRDWESANHDFNMALQLEPDLMTVHLSRGRMYLEAGRLETAEAELDCFLVHQPNHLEGRITRARVLVRRGRRLSAVKDYDHAIALLSRPTPEYFLERAQALVAEGPAYWGQALGGLNDAVEYLGPLVTLQQLAINIEVDLRRYGAALERLNTIARWLPTETRLARRGEIFLKAGRTEEAQKEFSKALAHIESLTPGRRQSKPMRELEARLRATGAGSLRDHR